MQLDFREESSSDPDILPVRQDVNKRKRVPVWTDEDLFAGTCAE